MKSITIICLFSLVLSLINCQPSTLYVVSGVSQNSLVYVDLSTGEISAPKNSYIFNVFLLSILSSSSETINFIGQGYDTLGLYEYNLNSGKFSQGVNVSAPPQLRNFPQPYGFDPNGNRAFQVGIPENGFSDEVAVNTVDFDNIQSFSTQLGYSDFPWDSLPTAFYDQYSSNYYIAQNGDSALTLYAFNTNNQQVNSTSFDISLNTPYVITNLQGQVFILDAPSNGDSYSLYLLSSGSSKLLLTIDSDSYLSSDLFPFAVANNYLVVLTKSDGGVTYSTVDLTSYAVISSTSSSSLPSGVSFISTF